MKKLMFAAAVAAMGTGAFASECAPEEVQVSRIYQVQFNVYTTKGFASTTNTGTICAPEDDECLVLRGKDKTVIRGYVYACQALCQIDDYEEGFVDSKRRALFGEISDGEFSGTAAFEWKLLNFMGSKFYDVETAWGFEGTVKYDEQRSQTYTLTGAGYGQRGVGATVFADKMSGYFAGEVTAPFDLANKSTCACEPSKVLFCDGYDSLDYQDANSVAFGAWKMKFNAKDSEAYLAGKWNLVTALKKIMK